MKKSILLCALTFAFFWLTGCTSKDETQKWTLTVVSSDETLGTVIGGGDYEYGTKVTIEAIEKEGRFEKWDDGCTDNPRQVVVTQNSRFVAQFVRLSSPQDPTPIPIDATLLVGDWRRDWNNPTFAYKGSLLRVLGFQFNADHSGLVYIDNYNGSGSILKVQTEWVIDGLCLLIGTHDETGYGTYTCFEQSENKISLTGQAGQFGLVRSNY